MKIVDRAPPSAANFQGRILMRSSFSPVALSCGIMLLTAASTWAGASRPAIPTSDLAGIVRAENGQPVSEALVTARNDQKKVSVSVYTSAAGRFEFSNLWDGNYRVTARKTGLQSSPLETRVARGKAVSDLRLALPSSAQPLVKTDPEFLRDLPDGEGKSLVRSVCIQCHGLTEQIAFQKKTPQEWALSVDSMLAKIAPLPAGQREIILDFLNAHFGPTSSREKNTDVLEMAGDYAANVVITEYDMPPHKGETYEKTAGAKVTAHDVRVDKNGNVWISEMGRDALVMLNPKDATYKEYDIAYPGSAPHGIIIDKKGDIWVTLIWADRILKFDPVLEKFTVDFKIPAPQSWPHTNVVDSKGRIWVTEMYGNAIGRYDPSDNSFKRYPVPTPRATPYGLTVDQQDNVWFTGITYHKFGKINAADDKITEYPTPTPLSATRKMAVDKQGIVWCTEFGVGKLAKMDPATGNITEYNLPSKYSSPYDVTVAPDGKIWFPDFTGNNIISFDPITEKFLQYRIPTDFSRPRIVDIGKDGVVWFSESEAGRVARLEIR